MRTNERKRVIKLGKLHYEDYKKPLESEVELCLYDNENGQPCFTASGSVWNTSHKDMVMGGQCLDRITSTDPLFLKIKELWKKYHLNDLNAGTIEQEKCLKEHIEEHKWDYIKCCDVLEKHNLLVVEYQGKPYKYGTAWLYREIPTEDLELIEKIISTGKM